MAPKKASAAEQARKKAEQQAQRQREAEDAFMKADTDGSYSVDAEELKGLLQGLLRRQEFKIDAKVIAEFVDLEFAKADSDGSGDVDFDEFCGYYNALLERVENAEFAKGVEEAKKAAAAKAKAEAIAEDDDVYVGLHGVVQLLSAPSVKAYSGLVVPFKVRECTGDKAPKPEHGSTSHGIVLDMSRRAQRLLTPWGALPIGYRLSFDGYQSKNPPADDEGGGKKGAKPKKPTVPWELVPAEKVDPEWGEKQPIMFLMARPRGHAPPGGEAPPAKLLQLKKLPRRCHYQVVQVLGRDVPVGEAVAISDAAEQKEMQARWAGMLKKYQKDPIQPQDIPAEESDGGPVINLLLQKTVAVRAERFELLKKLVAGRAANKKFPDEDLVTAMLSSKNDQNAAKNLLNSMQSNENTVLERRKGHATRAMVRDALQICENDADMAEYYLIHKEKNISKLSESIYEQRGISTGIGYPTLQDIERKLVSKAWNKGKPQAMEVGPVLADLKREWKADLEAMADMIAASEVEEMLTPEICDSFAFSRPITADEAQHVETLYLSDEFGRDKDKVKTFLSEAGTVLKRSATLGAPARDEVEMLLRRLEGDSEKVIAFLTSAQNLFDIAPKNGGGTREDCSRMLEASGRDEAEAMELMKTIWKIAKPTKPKPVKNKPEQPFLAELCGFPSKEECEWSLLGTKAKGKISQAAAMDLLKSLHELYSLKTGEGKWKECAREDFVWSLDPARVQKLTKVRPLSLDEYKELGGPPQLMLNSIDELVTDSKENGLNTGKSEVLNTLEQFNFDVDKSMRWLKGVGTLMQRQMELGIISREEVEQAMEYHALDDAKVIELFQETANLEKKKAEIGNPSRAEIQAMLTLAWEKDNREDFAGRMTKLYRELINNDDFLASLFGPTLEEAERNYLKESILRFDAEPAATIDYLKKVADIERDGEKLGHPSRETIIDALNATNDEPRKQDVRVAKKQIREKYQKERDILLKAEYERNKAAKDKAAAAS